jgi:hypothetical protein
LPSPLREQCISFLIDEGGQFIEIIDEHLPTHSAGLTEAHRAVHRDSKTRRLV